MRLAITRHLPLAIASLALLGTAAQASADAGPAATVLQAVGASADGTGVTITLRGNGPLQASAVATARDLPPRVLLDFPGVSIAPAVQSVVPVGHGDVRRVRVALHSATPRVTRVVIDLARAVSFDVTAAGGDGHELRITFDHDVRPGASARPAAPSAGPSQEAASVLSGAAPRSDDPGLASPGPRLATSVAPGPHVTPPPGGASAGGAAAVPTPPAPSSAPVPATRPVPADAAAPGPLAVGHHVKVEGRIRPDGGFDAVQVVLRDPEHSVKIEGRVQSVRTDRRGLSALGFDVTYGRDLTLYRGSKAGASRAELVPGTWIEVKGVREGPSLVASRIRIKEAPEATEEIESAIEHVAAPDTVVVLGRPVRIGAGVPVVDERTAGAPAGADARLRRDDDEQSRAPWRLGSRVVVGGRLESAWLQEGNYDLDTTRDHRDRWLSRAQVLGSATITSSVEAYAKVSVYRTAELAAASLTASHEIDVQEAYVTAHRIGGLPLDLQVGRQRFRDNREWFYDEYMDAVRATAHVAGFTVEGALSDGIFAGPDATRDDRDHRHRLAMVSRTLDRVGKVAAFVIDRNDRSAADDDPRWLGLSLDLKGDRGSRLWALGSARRGHRGPTRLGGWAADAGGTWLFADLPGQPSVTAGYAFSSGDLVSGDGRDTRFRQTDLEDNAARFGGLRRLTYYGELFDPELSNLQVVTAGAGLRPRRNLGLDLVLHRYVQTVLRTSLPSSAFDVDTTGRDGRLGHELDLALTLRAGRVDLDVAAGVFLSGPGLATTRRVAFFWRPQVRVYF